MTTATTDPVADMVTRLLAECAVGVGHAEEAPVGVDRACGL